MNNQEELIKTQCEAFRGSLERARYADLPLNYDFVGRFNGFLAKNPHVLYWKNKHGRTLLGAFHGYLVRAIGQEFPLETFQALVIQTPKVLAKKDRYGYMLLHEVCWRNSIALDVIYFFVNLNPDAAKALSRWKETSLHLASRNKAPLPVIRVLVDANPRAMETINSYGKVPLQFACCRGAPLDVIQYLVMRKPHLCLRRCKYGELPLVGAQVGRHGEDRDDIIEFMTTATTAVARVLMKRLRFDGLLPGEMFASVSAYCYGGGRMEAVSVVNSALSQGENDVLFRREEIQAEFCDEIGIEIPSDKH